MENLQNFEANKSVCGRIIDEMKKVIVGKDEQLRLLLISLLSKGHILIEDVPGVGKTTAAAAMARATGLDSKRVQFTPDVMATDISGFTAPDAKTGEFVYKPGVCMTNILIADEINRTSPKTQSALLEAMEERQVSVDGVTYKLPEPFMVVATKADKLSNNELAKNKAVMKRELDLKEEELVVFSAQDGRGKEELLKRIEYLLKGNDAEKSE